MGMTGRPPRRGTTPRGKKSRTGEPFGFCLAMLSNGASLDRVLDAFCGRDVLGAKLKHRIIVALNCFALRDGEERPQPIAQLRDRAKRTALRLLLRIANGVRRAGSRLIATGPDVYFGRQVLDEAREIVDRHGCIRHTWYCPMADAGGLAVRIGCSVSTLFRALRVFREAEVLSGNQPPEDAPEAGLSGKQRARDRDRDGRYAYAEHWFKTSPPPAVLRRLELVKPAAMFPPRAPAAAPSSAPSSAPPAASQGPPPDDPDGFDDFDPDDLWLL
jgi:hypothetical protein